MASLKYVLVSNWTVLERLDDDDDDDDDDRDEYWELNPSVIDCVIDLPCIIFVIIGLI